MAALRSLSLVRVVADGLYVHQLSQTMVRAVLDEDAERVWASAAIHLLRVGLPARASRSGTGRNAAAAADVLAVAGYGQRLEVETEE